MHWKNIRTISIFNEKLDILNILTDNEDFDKISVNSKMSYNSKFSEKSK